MDNVPATVEQNPMVLTVEDVKKYIAPDATDKELFLFMNIAKSYGLNPFKREIHFVQRRYKDDQEKWHTKQDVVIGYEVYLKRAEATGKLDGWEVAIQGKGQREEKSVITIFRKDRSKPFRWEVERSEFDTKKSTWLKMPQFMLKKVAMAQGFRLCFPEELGGLPYIPEEINGKASEELPRQEMPENGHPEPVPPVSPGQPKGFKEFLRTMGSLKADVGDKVYYQILGANGVEHANQLKTRDAQVKVYKELQAALAVKTVDETFPGAEQTREGG